MDMTPPLTRSSVSTPKTCCPSDAGSSGYPSPGLFEQHYKISAYDVDHTCPMAPAHLSRPSSPHLDAATHADWSPASVLHPALTTSSMTRVLTAEYDTFVSYDGPLSASYPTNVYTARGHHSPAATLPVTRSPVTPPPQVALQYPPLSGSSPTSPRLRPEGMSSEYDPGLEASHYPSPSLASAPYPAIQTDAGYPPEAELAPWARPEHYQPESEAVCAGAAKQPPAPLAMRQETRCSEHERPRRAPRKLTTKEEANFQCDVKGCGKFFSRSYNFKAHLETHRERRDYPFPCLIGDCAKKFVRKTDLVRHHQSVHMKERNHGCDYCGRMFARRDTLKR